MSTGTALIKEALQQIGAFSFIEPAQPENIETGMNVLNSMLQIWLSMGADIGIFPLDAPGDELGEPLDTRQVIVDNLAIALQPHFENASISQQLRANATIGFMRVRGLYRNIVTPDRTLSSTMIRGQGNRRSRAFRQVYVGKGATIPASDA